MISDPLLAPSSRQPDREPERRTDRAASRQPERHARSRPATRSAPRHRRPLTIGLGALAIAAVAAVGVTFLTGDDDGNTTDTTVPAAPPPVAPTAAPSTLAPTTTLPSIDVPGSLWWLVNRDRPLPDGYVPPGLVTPNVPLKPDTGATQVTATTAAAFEAMVADAATAGFQLQLNSGYRSYEQQQMLYDRFVQDYGAEVAAQRVAPPGTSEHQTGLAADVGLVGLPDDQLFGDTDASVWVSDHAHEYGFIVRYPPEKAHITGYDNEPWHLRFVGVELATQLHASGLTMEEHFGLVPAEAAVPPATTG